MKKVKPEKKKTDKARKSGLTTFDAHLDKRYGRVGTAKRTEFEIKAKAFELVFRVRVHARAQHLLRKIPI